MTHPPRDPERLLLNRPPRTWPQRPDRSEPDGQRPPAMTPEADPMPVRTYEDCLIDEYTRPLADAVAAQMGHDADTAVREVRADRARLLAAVRKFHDPEPCVDCGRYEERGQMVGVGPAHLERYRCCGCWWLWGDEQR